MPQSSSNISPRKATLSGFAAILLWALLGPLTKASGNVPPLQLMAMSFGVAFLVFIIRWRMKGLTMASQFSMPLAVWLLGIVGYCGNLLLYFYAMRNAPVAQINLINYVWPMLIILFSAALPGERLRWWHLLGAVIGFVGVLTLFWTGERIDIQSRYVPAYIAVFCSAAIWAGFSVTMRRVKKVPSEAFGAFAAGTALLALVSHLAVEQTAWPATPGQWIAVAGLSLGPICLAYIAWNIGIRHGHVRLLAAGSFSIPILSTLILVLMRQATLSVNLAVACLLVVGGAVVASMDMFRAKSKIQ